MKRFVRWAVAAFVGVLIAVAGAAVFVGFFLKIRPKAPEAKINLAAIRTAELAYFEEFGVYVAAAPTPAQLPPHARTGWPLSRAAQSGFDTMGWAPEGAVRCQYAVAVEGAAFTAEALCAEESGSASAWGYVHPAPGESRGIPGPFGRCDMFRFPVGVCVPHRNADRVLRERMKRERRDKFRRTVRHQYMHVPATCDHLAHKVS